MKLSAHYNRASIIITIGVLLVGAVIYFFAINYVARNQLNRDLDEELGEVIDYINVHKKLPREADFDEDQTFFVETNKKSLQPRYFDTVYNDFKENENEPGRGISGLISLNSQHYIATVIISREGTEYFIQLIGTITLILMVCLLLILFITNRYILNGLWKPFYETVNDLNAFNIADGKTLNFKPSKVDEFNQLNTVVGKVSSRVKGDYQHLKYFTENASHEMQTPLAVITTKLDTLIQDETLKPEQFSQISDIYLAAGKLSKLNQSLLLLVKIEHNLIDDVELLSFDRLIRQKIRQFHELMLAKNIELSEHLDVKNVMAGSYLLDILLNNLLSNAIRHNNDHGRLIISLTADRLIIQNNGAENALDSDNLFERFRKGKKSEGTGLGLTIVKNICSLYNWDISYSFENSMHSFQITFDPTVPPAYF